MGPKSSRCGKEMKVGEPFPKHAEVNLQGMRLAQIAEHQITHCCMAFLSALFV